MTTATVFEHEMLREIYQQPKALADTIERYAPNGKLEWIFFNRSPTRWVPGRGW